MDVAGTPADQLPAAAGDCSTERDAPEVYWQLRQSRRMHLVMRSGASSTTPLIGPMSTASLKQLSNQSLWARCYPQHEIQLLIVAVRTAADCGCEDSC